MRFCSDLGPLTDRRAHRFLFKFCGLKADSSSLLFIILTAPAIHGRDLHCEVYCNVDCSLKNGISPHSVTDGRNGKSREMSCLAVYS